MINEVKLETPEEKTLRLLQRVSKQTIEQIVKEFHQKSQALLFICKKDAIAKSKNKVTELDANFKSKEEQSNYESIFAAEWHYRAEISKNRIYPASYEDAVESKIWQYGWTYEEFKNGTK